MSIISSSAPDCEDTAQVITSITALRLEKREKPKPPYCTVRTGIIEPPASTLELPLLVRSGSFFFFFCLKHGLRESIFAVREAPYPGFRMVGEELDWTR